MLVVPLRDPFTLAKQLASAALLSNNRIVLGTGVGWLREEFETIGRSWTDRGQRMDEMLDILCDFWGDGYAEYHGDYYDFERSGMFPVPTAPIPIWVGGHSAAAARRAARFDGYMPMRGIDDDTRHEFDIIRELHRSEGRQAPFDRIVTWGTGPDPEHAAALEAHGVTNVIVHGWAMNDASLSLRDKHTAAEAFASNVIQA